MTDATIQQRVRTAAQTSGLEWSDVIGPSRRAEFVQFRRAVARLLYGQTGLTTTAIAELVGRRSHVSVVEYVKHRYSRTGDGYDWEWLGVEYTEALIACGVGQ